MANLQNPKELQVALAKARFGILVFIAIYFFLILVGIALVALCIITAIFLLSLDVNRLSLFMGIVLLGIALLMVILLFRFITSHTKRSRDGLFEITKSSEPELFKLISEISKEVGTDMPKHVYLSQDVNAAVFFDSSLLSLVFPAKKNLLIGLSLVNMTTREEFKAILAHEFGHFAQKSMRVGSFVYHANIVIGNVLFMNEKENDASTVLDNLGIAGGLALTIMNGIKFIYDEILKWVYQLINVQNYQLSREMEYQADGVAAKVSSAKALSGALLRMDICSSSAEIVKSHFYSHSTLFAANIFHLEKIVLNQLSKRNQLSELGGLPIVGVDDYRRMNSGHITFDNKWSSHPSTLSRVERLDSTGGEGKTVDQPAWSFFTNPEASQKKFSESFFKTIFNKERGKELTPGEFEEHIIREIPAFEPPLNHVYHLVSPKPLDFSNAEVFENTATESIESLFSEEKIAIFRKLTGLRSDLEVLNAIHANQEAVKSFQINDISFPPKSASGKAKEVELQIKEFEAQIADFDRSVYLAFLAKANSGPLKSAISEAAKAQSEVAKRVELNVGLLNNVIQASQFFYRDVTHQEKNSGLKDLTNAEKAWQVDLKKLLEDDMIQPKPQKEELQLLNHYCLGPQDYESGHGYHLTNIRELQTVIAITGQWLINLNHQAASRLLRAYESVLKQ